MNQTLCRLKINWCRNYLFFECKRFAGHSKWANIKHNKEEMDSQRATLFHNLKQKMAIAIKEGGSVKPSHNAKLAQLILQAKQVNMPVASINSFLEKMANAQEKSASTILDIRGPGGCILIVRIFSAQIIKAKMEVQNRVKKYSSKLVDSSVRRIFHHFGHINAEKDCNLDNAMEDAIQVDAEDVEEIQENKTKYFKFKCKPESINKIVTQLQKLDYNIVAAEETFTPHTTVELSEADLDNAESLCKKLLEIDGVDAIYDNIAR